MRESGRVGRERKSERESMVGYLERESETESGWGDKEGGEREN